MTYITSDLRTRVYSASHTLPPPPSTLSLPHLSPPSPLSLSLTSLSLTSLSLSPSPLSSLTSLSLPHLSLPHLSLSLSLTSLLPHPSPPPSPLSPPSLVGRQETRKLWRHIEPYFRGVMSKIYLREISRYFPASPPPSLSVLY